MKKIVLSFLAAWGALTAALAQDLIVKTDTAQIEARVTEITPEVVRYKRFSNPEGPTYVLPVSEIRYIRYANGEVEYYLARVFAGVSEAPDAAEYVPRTYEIGELYDRNGVRGVVCSLSEDKMHGLVISLDEICLPWSEFRKPDLRTVGTDDRTDGAENMEALARYIAENGLSWSDFPAFEWCRSKGEGWYLPAIDELLTAGHNYNGGTRVLNSRPARNRFNGALKEAGGKRMDRMVYYFSSTELDGKNALTTHMSIEPPYVVEIPKYNKFLVRAVHRF